MKRLLYVSDPPGMDRELRRASLEALKDLNETAAKDFARRRAEDGVRFVQLSDWGWDFHGTNPNLLGFDHERLTYRFQGRDYRLTDVHGHVVKELLA